MKSKVVLVAFLLMLYITLMIPGPSYTAPSIADESNFTLSSSENWLSGWSYRKLHNLTGSAGADVDYPINIRAYFDGIFELEKNDSWADFAHQGITTDGTYVYTTNNSMLSKYTNDGTYQDSVDYTNDMSFSGRGGDLCYYDNYLYLTIHNDAQTNSTILKYSTGLVFQAEYDLVEPTVSNNFCAASASYHDGYFWTISDSLTTNADFQITKYSLVWSYLDKWTVSSFPITGTYHYQGIDWYSNYIFLPIHAGSTPEKIDVYKWNGSVFEQYMRLDPLSWVDDYTYTATQGIAISGTKVWFASRGGVENKGQVGVYDLSFPQTDYENNVYLDGKCQDDFDDIRFTDNDGETLLDYWLETDHVSYADFWVEVKDSLDIDGYIYVYYGNDEASSLSDGNNVFLEFADFEEGDLTDVNFTYSTAQASNTYSRNGAYSGECPNDGSALGFDFGTGYEMTNVSYIGWFYDWSQSSSDAQFRMWDDDDPNKAGAGLYHDVSNYSYHYSGYNYYSTLISRTDGWHKVELREEGSDLDFLIDNILVKTISKPTEIRQWYGISYNDEGAQSAYFDDMFIRKCIVSEPSHSGWGAEEIYSPPEWTQISSITLVFQVPLPLWSFNVIMIFAGLIMMPVSTLYLVHGGRKGLSNDKVFYTLLMFFMGFALFLGGIMP